MIKFEIQDKPKPLQRVCKLSLTIGPSGWPTVTMQDGNTGECRDIVVFQTDANSRHVLAEVVRFDTKVIGVVV